MILIMAMIWLPRHSYIVREGRNTGWEAQTQAHPPIACLGQAAGPCLVTRVDHAKKTKKTRATKTCGTEGGVHHLQGVELAHVDVNLNGNLLWWEILKWVVHVKICCGDTVCKRKWSKVEKIFLKGSIKNTKRSLKLDQVYCAWLSKGLLIMPVSGDLGGWHRSLTDTLTHTHTDNRI